MEASMEASPERELGAPFKPLEAYDAEFTPMGEELGRGASGVVRRATRKRDGLGVAVKTIDLRALRVLGGTGFSIARLRREVDVMLGLRHPNIVELYGAYGNRDGVRLVMELVEGQELFDAILSRGKFDEADARPIFGAVCAAVAYMHGRGVIHRDLKPENVLLAGSVVKLVDFGLSKLVASHRGGSAARTLVGTPSYLAPEIEELKAFDLDALDDQRQPGGGDESGESANAPDKAAYYDAKVDAWSLGVTLYVMLIARFPVYKRSQAGQISGVELPVEANRLSPTARSLIVRLLDANPKSRCSVADALRDAWLETAVAKMPSLALALAQQPSMPVVRDERAPAPPTTLPANHHPRQPVHAVFCGLANAHASLVAAAALQLPPDMRRAGLVYHERVLASRGLASKLRSTAGLVLETLDDLAFAVDAKEPQAARDILGNIKRWTAELGDDCARAKTDNLASMRDLADSVGVDPGSSGPPPEETSTNLLTQQQTTTPTATRRRPSDATSLDLASDDHVLELMLPVAANDDLHEVDPLAEPIAPVLKYLADLHVVFSRMELFWSKVEVSLDTILRRNEALDLLLKFSNPALKSRFDTRLHQFRQFWADLATWEIEAPSESHSGGSTNGPRTNR
ncbi:hypothetical protein CTAYLR_002147 [Chrysophaeum taylorii]|uniref:Protein kinase domain-containing protein n=1 Tax=Chrysophaeum taylorii TaxID=2483200 RepID=A0AAD7UN81_9STRA|nr:hypothetical protein CTAYLR_002147 [Chrysophaeum taylorii]